MPETRAHSGAARRPELVAPAGTPAKLLTAFHFGADAVYLGLRSYSLRSGAGNFDLDELEWALGQARALGRRVYVALNIQPFDSDLGGIDRTLRALEALGPDGVVLADPAVLALARRSAPRLRLHLSTQASVTNSEAARFWLDQGLARVIVARELDLDRLAGIVRGSPGEVEAFVHGAVCVAYSGRCLLSLYWAGRDPRRGDCAQGCRWRYGALVDRRRPELDNPVEEDERGTYFFDAKDLCALPVLDRLVDTGLAALKIEGRTRSAHYLGVTVDVYRSALDRLAEGDRSGFRASVDGSLAELGRAGGRGFSTHFLAGEQDLLASYNPEGSYRDGRFQYLGQVVARDGRGLIVRAVNPIAAGVEVEVRGPGLRSERTVVERLVRSDGEPLDLARAGDEIRLEGELRAGAGDLVRLAPLRSDR